jgi:hypothetical protein
MKTLNLLLVGILMSALLAGAAAAGQDERSDQQEFEDNYNVNDGD